MVITPFRDGVCENEDIYDSIFVEEKSKEYVEYELYRIISIIDISNE